MVCSTKNETVSGFHSDNALHSSIGLLVLQRTFSIRLFMVGPKYCLYSNHVCLCRVSLFENATERNTIERRSESWFMRIVSPFHSLEELSGEESSLQEDWKRILYFIASCDLSWRRILCKFLLLLYLYNTFHVW